MLDLLVLIWLPICKWLEVHFGHRFMDIDPLVSCIRNVFCLLVDVFKCLRILSRLLILEDFSCCLLCCCPGGLWEWVAG